MFYESHRDLSVYYSLRDNNCSTHFHQSPELLYCIDKPKQVVIDGEEITVNANELLIVFPYETHRYLASNGKNLCVAFPPKFCGNFISTVGGKKPSTHVIKNVELTSDIYKHLQLLNTNVSEITLNGITNYVLGRILDSITLNTIAKYNSNIINDILIYIDNHYAEKITLESLASKFSYSKFYFSNIFNKKLKMSVSEYVNTVRVNKSLKLLGKMNVQDIAFKVGFNSSQQYFLNFKKVFNTTPNNYAKTLSKQ